MTYSNCFFCVTNNPKPKEVQFTINKSNKSSHLRSWKQKIVVILALKMITVIISSHSPAESYCKHKVRQIPPVMLIRHTTTNMKNESFIFLNIKVIPYINIHVLNIYMNK